MAAINFPTATADGQTFEADTGVIYTYNGTPPNGFWSGSFGTSGLDTLDAKYILQDDDGSVQTIRRSGLKINDNSNDTILLNSDGSATFASGITVDRATAPSDVKIGGSDTYAVWLSDSNFILKHDGSAYFASNVGIGTTSPSALLHVDGSAIIGDSTFGTASQVTVYGNTGGIKTDSLLVLNASATQAGRGAGISIGDSTTAIASFYVNRGASAGTGNAYLKSESAISFLPNNTTAATFDTSGRLLLGATSSNGKFYNSSTVNHGLQIETTAGYGQSWMSHGTGANLGAHLTIGRSRGTSAGSVTVVQNGDNLGLLSFQGADGTECVEAAQIKALVDGTPGANDMPGALTFSTNGGTSAPTERMRIDSSGRLLVGNTSEIQSGSQLEITGTNTGGVLTLGRNDSSITSGNGMGAIDFYGNAGGTYQQLGRILSVAEGTHALGDKKTGLAFYTNNGTGSAHERVRVDGSGNVGIGTSSATDKLTIAGGGIDIADNHSVNFGSNQGGGATILYNPNGNLDITPRSGYNTVFTAGNVGIGTTSPSQLLHLQSTSAFISLTDSADSGDAGILFRNTSGSNRGTITYSFDDDAIKFRASTDGSGERMRLDSSGRLLVGTTSASTQSGISAGKLQVLGGLVVGTDNAGTSGSGYIAFDSACTAPTNARPLVYHRQGVGLALKTDAHIAFEVGANEKARIDSSGRLLVGHTSSRGVGSSSQGDLQVEANGPQIAASIVNNYNSTTGGILSIGHSRSSDPGGVTIVQSGDELGEIRFAGADGTDLFSHGAAIAAIVDNTPGNNDMPGRLVFSTTPDLAASPIERVRIDRNGLFRTVTTTHGVEAVTTQGAGTSYFLFRGHHSGTAGTPGSGTISFQVLSNGNTQNTNNSFTGISDVKLKENIVDASSQWDDIKSLQVRNYNFKAETNYETHTQIGLVAQEVETVSPGLVIETPDLDADNNDLGTTTKSVNYSVLYMKAVKALQEAMDRIETLEAKVAALEAG